MSDDTLAGMIDPRIFIKQLPPDQLGMFEPLSGLMLLNISHAELVGLGGRWSAGELSEFDLAIIRTINHEAYHFAQAAASGYVYHRQARLFMVLNSEEPETEVPLDAEMQAFLDVARAEVGDDPELRQRYEAMVAFLEGHNQFALLDARAAAGDHSVMGALLPGFFAHMETMVEEEGVANSAGLSILGLLEGSAVAHTHLLMHPGEDATPYIEAELETLPPVYGELHRITVARAGSRALELILPAVTLALRYAQPHQAYLPLLERLAESAAGEALEYGRALGEQLPELPDAGPLFGTALDLRRMHEGYRMYDPILEMLSTGRWGIDSYDFLAQPAAMQAVGIFPLGIVTTDGYVGALPRAELAARMVVMGVVLRSQSRRRAEREFRKFQVEWARGVIARLIGDVPPSVG